MKFVTVNNFGYVCYMPYAHFREQLHKNERQARDLLKDKNVDHVIYGYIRYDSNDDIDTCYLSMLLMDDDEFYKRTNISHHLLYAVHKNN